MARDIHQMNARTWETLVISILKVYLLSTTDTIPVPRNKSNRQKDNNAIVISEFDEILLHKNQK